MLNASDDEIRLIARFAVEVAMKCEMISNMSDVPAFVRQGFEDQWRVVQILIRHLSPQQQKVYRSVSMNPRTRDDLMKPM